MHMNSFFKKVILGQLTVLIVFLFCGCENNNEMHSQTRDNLLGTIITISAYENISDSVFDECFSAVYEIEKKMSVNIPESEISSLNNFSEAVLSDDTYNLIQKGINYSELSNGAFDITIGAVMEKWKQGGAFIRLPEPKEIEDALPFVGYDRIRLSDNNKAEVEKGTKLDLGGIAKGYACDKTVELLKKHNIKAALLDFGGNIYAHGTKQDGSPWRVGLRNPILGEDGYVCILEVSDKTVVTSGGYERYFENEGKAYHHLLDPKTGYQAENDLLSVTIVGDISADADALSTACFVLGKEDGMRRLEDLPGFDGIFITNQNEIYITSNLKDKVTLKNTNFKIV